MLLYKESDIENLGANARYHLFEPLMGDSPRILILGTFPSPLSRSKNEYYGNPRNMFWKILFDVFGQKFNNPCYEVKKRLVYKYGIAVWDVIESCEIEGALDSNIRNPVYNTKIPVLLKQHNSINTVFFNGGNSYKFYKKGIGSIEKKVLPSTSPANARVSYETKLKAWAGAIKG